MWSKSFLQKKVFIFFGNTNPEKPKKSRFKNVVPAGISGFMYDFFVYDEKNSVELEDGKFGHLQKFVQVVVKLCNDLSGNKKYGMFFDNWFTTLDLLHHFRSKGIYAVWTIRLNRLRSCPLDTNKDLMKND